MSADISHDELARELPSLEKLSNAARQKLAKKRRAKQLKKYQEVIRLQRQTSTANGGSSVFKKKGPPKIQVENGAVLNDMVARNDIIGAQKLLQAGADPNVSNADGLTLLHKCCIDDALELAEILVEHGADLNARDVEGWTPLHAASATGNIQMIHMLVDEGASLVAINHNDKMPIDESADSDIKYVLQQKMLEAGYTEDVLGYIRESVAKTMLADLKDSIKNNRSLNMQDKYGAAALHVAAANGYTEVLDFLFSHEGLNLDIQDNEGWTPFHAAVCWDQKEAMKMLAQKGANMDVKDLHGDTAYAIADTAELREYILELKGQYGESQVVELEVGAPEETGHRQRRLSVKRISQHAKEEMAKQSVQEEAFIRRTSIADAEKARPHMNSDTEKSMLRDLAGDDDEDNPILLSAVQLREQTSLSPVAKGESHSKSPKRSLSSLSDGERDTEASSSNHKKEMDPFEIEEHTSRQRPTILRKSNHPIRVSTTYMSSANSPQPVSPTGSHHSSHDQKCCTIL